MTAGKITTPVSPEVKEGRVKDVYPKKETMMQEGEEKGKVSRFNILNMNLQLLARLQ